MRKEAVVGQIFLLKNQYEHFNFNSPFLAAKLTMIWSISGTIVVAQVPRQIRRQLGKLMGILGTTVVTQVPRYDDQVPILGKTVVTQVDTSTTGYIRYFCSRVGTQKQRRQLGIKIIKESTNKINKNVFLCEHKQTDRQRQTCSFAPV